MKSRATIFLSGVSHEFGSFRDAVEIEIEMKGCFAENQPGLPAGLPNVGGNAPPESYMMPIPPVIHIVGFRFGAEPEPPAKPRRSYTQMESTSRERWASRLRFSSPKTATSVMRQAG